MGMLSLREQHVKTPGMRRVPVRLNFRWRAHLHGPAEDHEELTRRVAFVEDNLLRIHLLPARADLRVLPPNEIQG